MHFDIYTTTAAGLCILYLAPAIAAIILCILLYRHLRSIGWLFLGVLFVEPLYRVAFRLARGLSWYHTSTSVGSDGMKIESVRFDVPMLQTTLYVFAAVGLFLLYRGVKHGTPSA